jgi:hypothetical protein
MNAKQITQIQALTGLYRMVNTASIISVNENSDALAIEQFMAAFQHLRTAPVDDVAEVNRRYKSTFNSAKALASLIETDRVQLVASYHWSEL